MAYTRLGDYASATKCFDKALAGYVEGEFATSDAFYLRCRFQRANMLEAKAECLLADDCWEDAPAVANGACEEHMAVHADRVDSMSEHALDPVNLRMLSSAVNSWSIGSSRGGGLLGLRI